MDATTQLNSALAGRYTVLREIGAGGMATVYLARDMRHDRNVALKLLNPELGAVLGVERFLSEIKVTANLQHPNLLPLFDSGAADGLLFYVMPFVAGESLRARLQREKQLPIDEAIRIATAILGALDYAHRHDVIHRDLKPENILLHDGQPVVADFGIALAVTNAGGNRITQTGLSLGTPQYMSPEQATGDRVVDGRTDQYSLAAVLYEMLTGDPPYVGSTAQAVIARLLTERPRDIRTARDTVPDHIALAVDRALARLPADRFPTASAFAEALQGRGTTGSVATSTASSAPRQTGAKPVARRLASPVPWIVTTALALAAAGALAISARRVPERPTVRFGILGPTTTSAAPGSVVAASVDGRTVVYESGGTGDLGIWVRRVDELAARRIEGAEGAEQPFLFPDGQWVGFVSRGQLRKAPIGGGASVLLSDLPGQMLGASWGTNDLIVIGVQSFIGTVPASGGPIHQVTSSDRAGGELQEWPSVLPGGKVALYGSWRNSNITSRIAKVDLATGKTTVFDNLPGTRPLGVLDGWLVYAGVGGVLTAVRFDEERAEPRGVPIPLAEHPRSGAAGASRAALSSSGLLVYQEGFETSQMMLVDMHGSMRPLSPEVRPFALPRFSPDGKSIAVQILGQATNDIWVYTIAGGTLTRVTTEGGVNDRPEWTPDGKRILFRSDRNGPIALWTQPADHSGPASLLYSAPNIALLEGVLTPDGKTLVFRAGTLGAADIWQRGLGPNGDTTRKPVAATSYIEWAPRLSPDGHWVAYSSDESGARQVYVQPFPGPGARVQVSVDGGDYPVWSRNQRFLFFRVGQRMMRAAVSTSSTFAVEARETLFTGDFDGSPGHANYDVTPDGQYLLMLKPAGGDAQTSVAYDWQYALRAQVSGKTKR